MPAGRGPVIVDVSASLAGHLAVAIRRHLEWAQRSTLDTPDGLHDLAEIFTSRANQGQRGAPLDDLWDVGDSAAVPRLLVTLAEAAQALACSDRAIKRLTADGTLPTVKVGAGLVRIRVADLEAYVAHLSQPSPMSADRSTPSSPEAA